MFMVDFGERLRQLRKQKNLTQKQLAALIGVKNSIISFYEVGERMPSPEMVVKLASALNVSTDYLLGMNKTETMDVSGLDDNDKLLVNLLIETLRNKNKKI